MIIKLLVLIAFNNVKCMEFPELDLSLPINELVIPFENALKDYGFFYLKNYDKFVSNNLIKNAFDETKDLFSQSIEYKNKYLYTNNRGYIGYSNTTGQIGFDGKQTSPDKKEGWILMWPQYSIPNKSFYGKNNWPDVHSKSIKNTFNEYKYSMHNLNIKLTEIFSLSLNLPKDYFFKNNNSLFISDQLIEIGLWHYFPLISNISSGIYACGEHADWNFLSLLAIDSNDGLQVKVNNKWYDIEYKKNMLIVNSGNMATVMTNGYYKSSYHRVLLTKPNDRYSMVYFISPNYEWKLDCLGNVCGDNNPIKNVYKEDMDLNSGQFLEKMFNAHTAGYSLKEELKQEL